MATRRSLLLAGLGSLTAVAAAKPIRTQASPALQKVKIIVPLQSSFVLSYLGARDAGVFSRRGIDLEIDTRPYAGFLASLPSKAEMVGTYSGLNAIEKINQGLDWVIIGGGLTLVQDVVVRKDAPFKTVADLRGKKIGTFSLGASGFESARAAIMDASGFDVAKDAQLEQVSGPALNALLLHGQVDAMIQLSSLTMAAEAQTDKFRVLFSPNEYWKQKTGYPIVWASPLVAWRSWVDEDRARAKSFAVAVMESFRWLRKPGNLDTAAKKYGPMAAVTTPADIAEYKQWLAEKKIFMPSWSRKAVEAQWKFLDVCQRMSILSKVPPEDKYALFVGELNG
jgi:ABC-type nitrate/sulfonate/bicarbonate transport system substrate-binding protein